MSNLYNYIKLYSVILEKKPKNTKSTHYLKNKIKNVNDLTVTDTHKIIEKYYK